MKLSEKGRKVISFITDKPDFDKHKERLFDELQQMERLGIVDNLLEIYKRLTEGDIQAGRKNILNSLVAYFLGITTARPNGEFAVEKRRTYGRAGFPDIDMDFDYARRHEIIEYLQQKYGEDRVGNVGTTLTLKTKAAVRKAVEILDPENSIDYSGSKPDKSRNYALQNEILNTLPKSQSAFKKKDGSLINCVDDACETFSDFARYMKQYPEVYRVARRLEGSISAYGCLAKDTLIKTDIGWVRIDQLDNTCKVAYIDKVGKELYTSDFHPHCTGIKKCYKMRLSKGTWIKVTDEHLIFTDQGCVEFEEIRKNPQKYKVYSVIKCHTIESIEPLEEQEVWDITFKDRDDFYQNEPNFIAQDILVHNCHAAGVIISPIPLEQICPLHITHGATDDDWSKKTVATQFSKEDVESLGLIKFDVLGLSTKTALAMAVKLVKENHGVDVDLSRLPLKDNSTLTLLAKGDTDGCFQAEKTGMKQTFQQIGIDSFDDLIVAIAMYRPGPKDYIPELSDRKTGKHKVEFPHPLLRKITQRTYGIMAYQEQVMQAFMALADLTASDGYMFMKGCAKKKIKIINNFKDQFLRAAIETGVPSGVAKKIWDDMEKFGGYAFNKSLSFSEKIITSENDISIQELYNRKRSGESLPDVYSPEGDPIEIVDVYDHGVIPTWEVEFSDGSKHVCTLDHKFMTNQGIRSLREIVERNLFVMQNWEIKNAKKERLDLPGMSGGVAEPKSVYRTQEKMRRIQTEQKDFCLSRLRAKIHEARALFSQEAVSTMGGNKVSSLFGIERKNIKKILGGNQKRPRKARGIQENSVILGICGDLIQRRRNSSAFLFDEETQRDSQISVPEKQGGNRYRNICSTRNIEGEDRTTQEMAGRKSRGFYNQMRFARNEAKSMALSPRVVSKGCFMPSWFQAFTNHQKQEIYFHFTKKTSGFYRQGSQGSCGIRWAIPFYKSHKQHEVVTKSTKRHRGKRSALSMGVSSCSNVLRCVVISSQKIQTPGVSTTVKHGDVMPGKRSSQANWQKVRVTSIKYAGLNQCYDLEVDSEAHLYCLSSGIVNRNSHATSYAYECWKTAYLKAHYMLEFMASRLSVEAQRRDFDLVSKYEDDLRKHNYKIAPPSLNLSKMHYVKIGERELLRPLIIRDVGDKAAHEIIENQPYKGNDLMFAFANKVGSAVNSKVVEALCDANLFGKDKPKSQLLRDFDTIKNDRKRGLGRQKGDLFAR